MCANAMDPLLFNFGRRDGIPDGWTDRSKALRSDNARLPRLGLLLLQ